MLDIKGLHHVAVICSDYQRSLYFYTKVLGFELLQETFRQERNSYKADLALQGQYCIELFSFPDPPMRASYPEATGLRHLAFTVDRLDDSFAALVAAGITPQAIRVDALTDKRFFFIADPDGLPLEFYER